MFSGIEAASVAIERLGLGWMPVAFSEIEPTACAVLAHRWPGVRNVGDITKVDWSAYRDKVDVMVGGPPCQDFSIAGPRSGLAGGRGNLTMEYLDALEAVRPTWALMENVPGILSSNRGRDWGAFRREVVRRGYNACWRVLDASQFGVPQRRRRLFVVLHLGNRDWELPSEVLAVADGVRRYPVPELEAWKTPARRTRGVVKATGVNAYFKNMGGHLSDLGDAAACLCATSGASDQLVTYPATTGYNEIAIGEWATANETAATLRRSPGGRESTLLAVPRGPGQDGRWVVRRLTPLEYLRLQGFDDDHFDGVIYRGRPLSNTAKYKLAAHRDDRRREHGPRRLG